MADTPRRAIELERVGEHRFRATNERGGTLEFSSTAGPDFTPIELLLVALGGCTALDVEHITGKRAEPAGFAVRAAGDKIRDADGNHLTNLTVTFRVEFPGGEAGDAARAVLPDAVRKSHERLCTVTRTIELGTPVQAVLS
ncbi:MAG: OsmC family protein [Jatrophihabitans sp.]|uniref:OsmC family protein n=1 Tax=Jatrophihabitans sp. TaxID=1932789 RepID=UPI0039154950